MPTSTNWSRTAGFAPTDIVEPRDTAEVVALVRRARESGTTVKAVGAQHSWSQVGCTDGVLLRPDHLTGLRAIDRQGGRVTVGAGIRLRDLSAALAKEGLALPILGSIDHQSVAGAIGTGTHGSSLQWGNMSTLATRIQLVDGTGEVRTFDESQEDLHGVRVHLGALGVLTEVTLQVEPAFRLEEQRLCMDWEEAVERLPELAAEAEYVKLWWLPGTAPMVVFRYSRTDAPSTFRPLARWIDEKVVNALVFDVLLRLGGRFPSLVAKTNRLVGGTYFSPNTAVGRSDQMFTLAMPPRHREAEWSVPLTHGGEAFRRVRRVIEDEALAVDFIVEARFVRGDDGWLSPAAGRDSVQLGAYMAHAPGIDRYLGGVAAALSDLDARPHWGKELDWTPAQVDAAYPDAARFRALAATLDPDGVFHNPFLRDVIGL